MTKPLARLDAAGRLADPARMAAEPRIVLLDVMDCLVHDPFYEEVLGFFGLSLEELFAVKSKSAWFAFECGQICEAQMRRRYFTDGRDFDLAGLKALMRGNYRLKPGIEDLLDDLRREGCELHALSNYPVWYELVEAATGLSRWLHWSFVSCKTQVRKPHTRAYLGAARSLGRAPTQCLFVDDRQKNCEAARSCGMPAVLGTSSHEARAGLVQQGWLVR